MLGVYIIDVIVVFVVEKDLLEVAGVLIICIIEDSGVDNVGLEEGDVIISINNKVVCIVLVL